MLKAIERMLWWTSLILLGSCGLEQFVYLAPIDKDNILGGKNDYFYSFDHTLSNDLDEFLGYEIFYKFYPAGSSEINNDIASLEEKFVSTQSILENKKFVRLSREGDSTLPLVPVSASRKGLNIRFKIDFLGLEETPPKEPIFTAVDIAGSKILEDLGFFLRRPYRPELPDQPKKFLPDDILADDPDVVTTGVGSIVTAQSPISISFCVLAYGRDSNYSLLYSEIIFLNRTSDSALQIEF